jgi:hypothetical protein
VKHSKAEEVSVAGAELPTFELKGYRQRESIQPGGGGVACTAEESGPGALAIVYAGETRGLQGVGAGLGVVPGEACADDAHGVWAGLSGLQQPQVNGCDVQGYLERSKQLTAGSIEGSE